MSNETITDFTKTPEFKTAVSQRAEEIFSDRLGRERGKIRKELELELASAIPEGGRVTSVAAPAAAAAPTPGDATELPAWFQTWLSSQHGAPQGAPAAERAAEPSPRQVFERSPAPAAPQGAAGAVPPTAPAAPPPGRSTLREFLNQQPSAQSALYPPGPPASDRGGPTPTSDRMAESDPSRWDQNHIDLFRAEAREAGLSEAKYVRDKFLSGLRGKTLVFSR